MIICAAISVSFQRNGKTIEAVVPGIRHSDCWALFATIGYPMVCQEGIEGFLNHKGAFMDRTDAYDHALACGQLSATTLESKAERREYSLYSEDII